MHYWNLFALIFVISITVTAEQIEFTYGVSDKEIGEYSKSVLYFQLFFIVSFLNAKTGPKK